MAKKEKKVDLKELAKNYAMLAQREAEIKANKEAVSLLMKEEMKKAGADKIETNYGAFTIYQRTTWEYSEQIKSIQDELKVQEKKEQESGIAKATFAESLRFTPIKK